MKAEVERVVSMDADQCKKVGEAFSRHRAAESAAQTLVSALVEKIIDLEKEAWDDVAMLAGFESIVDAHAAGKVLSVNHLTRTVTVEIQPVSEHN